MEAILEKRKSRKTENALSSIGAFNAKKHQMFSNIVKILSIIPATPATSASVERANSALRYVKTHFRSTHSLSEDRFNALLLLYLHSDSKLDYKKIVDMYAMRYAKRMVLKNPLTEQ